MSNEIKQQRTVAYVLLNDALPPYITKHLTNVQERNFDVDYLLFSDNLVTVKIIYGIDMKDTPHHPKNNFNVECTYDSKSPQQDQELKTYLERTMFQVDETKTYVMTGSMENVILRMKGIFRVTYIRYLPNVILRKEQALEKLRQQLEHLKIIHKKELQWQRDDTRKITRKDADTIQKNFLGIESDDDYDDYDDGELAEYSD